jgi:hypothetical protein
MAPRFIDMADSSDRRRPPQLHEDRADHRANHQRAEGGTGARRCLRYRLIHTGQHYDKAMSGGFFEQLGIPEPDINLEVGSGTQAEQTAAIMVRYEKVLLEQRSDLCLVVGDVTSTMACSIVARKLGVPVAHVEGGIRSGDWTMPEEINRVVTDSITNWFFTTSATANENLRRAGVAGRAHLFRRQYDDRYPAQADATLAAAGVSGRNWACSRGSISW